MKRFVQVNLNLPKTIGVELSLREQVVLSHITGLSQKKGYCYASNNTIVKDLNIPYRTLCRVLDKLEDLNLIKRQTKWAGHYGKERKIYVSPSVKVAQYNK
jgi:DNA-binding MarR family transcriptional regulator